MRIFSLLTIFCLPAGAALGQAAESPWSHEVWADAAIVLAPSVDREGAAPDDEPVVYEANLGGGLEWISQDGLRIGARGALRLQRDHPSRPGFSGALVRVPVTGAGGAFSGLGSAPGVRDTGPRARIEAAYFYVEGGYGELSLGRDIGVAARFHEGDVGLVRRARIANSYFEPTGLAAIRTRHDLTGPAAKISYVTPRLIGIRAGLSFTPEADVSGLDRNPLTRPGGPQLPRLENAIELAANASRRFRTNGVRLRAGLAVSRAELEPPAGFGQAFDDAVNTVSGGGEVEWRGSRIGANWLHSDEGLAGDDYAAWSFSAAHDFGGWAGAVSYGSAEIDVEGLDATGFSLEVQREFGPAAVTLAWQDRMTGLIGGRERAAASGVVVEITLQWEK